MIHLQITSLMHRMQIGSILALLTTSSVATAGGLVSWLNPVDGLWADPNNWVEGLLPGMSRDVEIGFDLPFSVWIESRSFAQSLTVINPNATVVIKDGDFLRLTGNIVNQGTIQINPDANDISLDLRFGVNASLSGTGTLELFHPQAKLIALPGFTLTIEPQHTIKGLGQIVGSIVNNGQITTNDAMGITFTDPLVNQSIIEARDAGRIRFESNADLAQSPEAVLRAAGEGAVIEADGNVISAGNIETINGGVLRMANSASLTQMHLAGQLVIEPSGPVSIQNAVFNGVDLQLVQAKTPGVLSISANNTFEGTGRIAVNADPDVRLLSFNDDVIFPDGYTIAGRGEVLAPTINYGTILADQPNEELRLRRSIDNHGQIQASNGATLRIRTGVKSIGGSITSVGEGSKLILDGATINGKVNSLRSIDGGQLIAEGDVRLVETLIFGQLHVMPNADVQLDGPIYIENGMVIDNASVNMQTNFPLYGSGVIQLIGNAGFSNFSIDEGIVIRGSGSAGGTSYNSGQIISDVPGGRLSVGTGVQNNNLIRAQNGGLISIAGGGMRQSDGARIVAEGQGSQIELGLPSTGSLYFFGGELETHNGGVVRLVGSSVEMNGVRLACDFEASDFSRLELRENCVLEGTIDLSPNTKTFATLLIADPPILLGNGTIKMTAEDSIRLSSVGSGSQSQPLQIGEGITLLGRGLINGDTIMHGVVSPGLGLGSVQFTGNLEMPATSKLQIDVNQSSADVVMCSRDVQLEGRLHIHFVDDFVPSESWVRTVVEADVVTTAGLHIDAPFTPSGLYTRFYSTGETLVIGQVPAGDMNLDGESDFFDVGIFLTYFQQEHPFADLNADGRVNFFDVSLFILALQ